MVVDTSPLEQSIEITAIRTLAFRNYTIRMEHTCNYLAGNSSWKALLHALECVIPVLHHFHTDIASHSHSQLPMIDLPTLLQMLIRHGDESCASVRECGCRCVLRQRLRLPHIVAQRLAL